MNRRNLLKTLIQASGLSMLPAFPVNLFAQSGYSGKLLLALQLDGGVDVTSFCDPKTNVTGELDINNWARSGEIQTAANIRYAPYAGNQAFFEKYAQQMLVINGVDAQTNAHSVGVLNNWSGRNSEGFPTLTALMAATVAPQLPLAYLNFGGLASTANIIRSSRINDVSALQNIIFPNQYRWDNTRSFRSTADMDRVFALHQKNASLAVAETTTPVGSLSKRKSYQQSLNQLDGLKVLGDFIPSQGSIQPHRQLTRTIRSSLHQQIQTALLSMAAGVTVSADLFEGGFDTHVSHDRDHPLLLANATDGIDYLWTTAEELGLDNRLVVVIGSDFSRTPYYNGSNGKDHWPIGSYIVMEKNVAYTNRVIGETDEGHNAYPINPNTLQRDNFDGAIIKPNHVHKALRNYLGLSSNSLAQRFPFSASEDFNFFG